MNPRKSTQQRRKGRRKRLYEENPYCQDCGARMVLPEVAKRDSKGRLPENLCTLKNVYPKDERRELVIKEGKTIIICLKCNRKRDKERALKKREGF